MAIPMPSDRDFSMRSMMSSAQENAMLSRLNLAGAKPIYDFVDMDYTAQVKMIKDTAWVVFNRAREKFLIMDRDMHGTPYVYMIVQDEKGGFQPFDNRALEKFRKDVFRGPSARKMLAELEKVEADREASLERQLDDVAYGMADHLKWMGRDVVPSTAWVARSLSYEKKREEIRRARSE